MDRDQAVQIDQRQKQYLQTNKIRPLFSDLVRELVLKQPENPIDFLINYLDKRPKRIIVCLQGYDNEERKRLAKIVSNKLNLKNIQLSQIFNEDDYHIRDDNLINQKVLSELKKVELVQKGVLISGYPNNLHQIDFIQKCGFLPDRYFLLPYDDNRMKDKLSRNYITTEVDHIVKRNQMQRKQLIQGLGETLDFLPRNTDEAAEILSSALSIKVNKKNLPYESPRILFVHPPYLVPSTLNALINKYLFHHVSVQKSLTKLTKKQNFKDYVQKHIRKSGFLTKQIQLALIETECKSASAKNKGFILSGWPHQKQNLLFLKQRYINPHIIFVFDLDPIACEQKFAELEAGNPQLFPVSPKPSGEQYKKQLATYSKLVEQLKNNNKIQVLPWSQSQKQVLKTFQSLIDNPKIYS